VLRHRVEKLLGIGYENRLLITDINNFSDIFDYRTLLYDSGFKVYDMNAGIEEFRLLYEQEIRYTGSRCAVVVTENVYVPYDIQRAFFFVELSLPGLFPNLDASTLIKYKEEMELISEAYGTLYVPLNTPSQTERFIREKVLTSESLTAFNAKEILNLKAACDNAATYMDWISIAKRVARIKYYSATINARLDTAFIDQAFEQFIFRSYGKLSGEVNNKFPPILPRALSLITNDGKKKAAIIVMDGMSLVDFEVLARYMSDIKYEHNASFALIPTTTSISRQCLLSGRFPMQLEDPYSLKNEERGFVDAGVKLGYLRSEIQYARGYEPDAGLKTKLLGIVINEVDDTVHGQRQGRAGMLASMKILAESGKLQNLIRALHTQGFEVYITADHGNTQTLGIGRHRFGVEVETKSKRMAVLKDFAEETDFLRENTVRFPGTYLDKGYQYYICKGGTSFDNKGDEVMTHGGISVDEVIVPFIKILEV
jgi:hypothetical protein